MPNPTTETRRHNRYRIDMTGAPADAAQRLLSAREDQMVTGAEWEALQRAGEKARPR